MNAAREASIWKQRQITLEARAFAAHQRELAAAGRAEGAEVRAEAARIRAGAARTRDDGARARDDAARVRDAAALVRDQAARARDAATRTREDSMRLRVARGNMLDHAAWQELFALDRRASDQSRDAAARDREAAGLDREAADKDRVASERDRSAATSDRDAADKDRLAAEKEAQAADADRAAAESDRAESDRYLTIADDKLNKTDRLAAMGRLAAGLAHELNNPLTALMATLGGMQLDLETGVPSAARLKPLLEDAQLATVRITQVVADVRAWLHEGDEQPARQQIDLEKLVDETLRLTAGAVEKVALVVVDLQQVPPVWGVPGRLSQVLANLLLNAASAIDGPPDKNQIRVRVRPGADGVVLEVEDTGSGISPDVLPHVFDPFFTTHEGSGGSGLGLAMCQRIVTNHGGTITLSSGGLGKGTIARVTLPSGNADAVQPRTSMGPAAPTRARVLLIDDDPIIGRMMSRLLAPRCDVTVAVNGAEGLVHIMAQGARWDLILCDVMMPVMNGAELYRRLTEVAPNVATELVFITGGSTTDETTRFLAGLPNVLLLKPFNHEPLYRLLDERTGGARPEKTLVPA